MSSFDVQKYKDKSILIVGGGTSTLDVNWEDINYDYLWTCNDFFLEERVSSREIDLYLLAFTTPFDKKLIERLKNSNVSVFFESNFFRRRENTNEFKDFQKEIGIKIFDMNVPFHDNLNEKGQKAGAAFRLIQLAMITEASKINFVGFDGFNKQFTNKHAFSKHIGLKDSDTRRDWETGYYDVFIEAFRYLVNLEGYERLQNLGEGFDYNLGTEISKEYFPLDEKTLEILGKGVR